MSYLPVNPICITPRTLLAQASYVIIVYTQKASMADPVGCMPIAVKIEVEQIKIEECDAQTEYKQEPPLIVSTEPTTPATGTKSRKRKTVFEVATTKKRLDEERAKTRVNVGVAFPRWRKLRDSKGLKKDAMVAVFLLDSYEKATHTPLVHESSQTDEFFSNRTIISTSKASLIKTGTVTEIKEEIKEEIEDVHNPHLQRRVRVVVEEMIDGHVVSTSVDEKVQELN